MHFAQDAARGLVFVGDSGICCALPVYDREFGAGFAQQFLDLIGDKGFAGVGAIWCDDLLDFLPRHPDLNQSVLEMCDMSSKTLSKRWVISNMDIRKRVGGNLRRIRKERGWTQEKLSACSRVSQSYVGTIERAQVNVSLDILAVLAKALGVSLRAFFEVTAKE